MRMLNDINSILEVVEVALLDATPTWKPGDNFDKNNPDYFIVSVVHVGSDEDIALGEYVLDGTEKTYLKAVEDFNRVCAQAAEKGFFRLTDFHGFDLY